MIIDIIVIILVALGFYNGLKRGLIKTVFDTLSLMVAIIGALKLSPLMISLTEKVISNAGVAFILGFVLSFLLVFFVIKHIGNRLEDVVEAVNLDFINKVLGGAVMALFISVVLSFVLYFGTTTKIISETARDQSFTYRLLEPLPEASKSALEKTKPLFKGFWNKMMDTFDAINEKGEELTN